MIAKPELTWQQVTSWRARRHHLNEFVPAEQWMDVVHDLCGLHAQLMSSAELTLVARVEGLPGDVVARALWDERSLFKTWAMRGTLHLLPAVEYGLWQAGWSTYRRYLRSSWFKAFGLTEQELTAIVAAIGEVLNGALMTREELADEVGRRTSPVLGDKLRESWGAVLKPASFQGHLCYGPDDPPNVRFTRPSSWLPAWQAHDPEVAVVEIFRRYLGTNAPADRDDLARWWGTTPAEVGRRIRALGDVVTEVSVEGHNAWVLSEHLDDLRAVEPPNALRLLPAFDQYVVAATRHAKHLLPSEELRNRVYRSQGWLSPVVVVDGRILGVWKYERRTTSVVVEVELFRDLPSWAKTAIETEADRIAAHLGGELILLP